jgi:hypothetical protein
LTLLSFFLFLAIAEWLADKVLRASLIGHIIVGLIYGVPLGNILAPAWQETFLALGYISLILIIFEGLSPQTMHLPTVPLLTTPQAA